MKKAILMSMLVFFAGLTLSQAVGRLGFYKPGFSTTVKCVVSDQGHIFKEFPLSECYKSVPYLVSAWKPALKLSPVCSKLFYDGSAGSSYIDMERVYEIERMPTEVCEQYFYGFGHQWMNVNQ